MLAAPLYRLTSGDPRKKKRGGKKVPSQDLVFLWTDECEEVFQSLKVQLTTAPVLGYPNYNLPFVLQTDASGSGLGAVLAQVAYASRGLSPAETRYPAHKLEFFALKWAVTSKFHDHFYGRKFSVLTDNNPLKYVMTTAKLDAIGHRWLSQLSTFDFEVQYRRGRDNSNADALSRMTSREVTQALQSCPQRVRGRKQGGRQTQCNPETGSPPGEPTIGSEEPGPSQMSLMGRWGQSPVLHYRTRNQKPRRSERIEAGGPVCLLLKEWGRLVVKDGIMYRPVKDGHRGVMEQLVLPEKLRVS